MHIKRVAVGSFLLAMLMLVAGCVVAPREGFYDHAHNRYWHANAWHDCADHDEHCR